MERLAHHIHFSLTRGPFLSPLPPPYLRSKEGLILVETDELPTPDDLIGRH